MACGFLGSIKGLEIGEQFAVGGNRCLLGFGLGHDGLLRGKKWDGNFNLSQSIEVELSLVTASQKVI